MAWKFFQNIKEGDKSKAINKLIKDSSPDQDFFLMVVLSILMATFGLLLGSSAVIIGSMLIAPVLYPVLGLSMGFIMSDEKLINRSLYTLAKSVFFGLIASFLVALFFTPNGIASEELVIFAKPSLLHAAVAVIAGLAASFSMVHKDLSETLPGVAISVSLVPPLAALGIGVAQASWVLISSSILVFVINVLGIVFASMLVFSTMNFYTKRVVAKNAIEREDKNIEEDKIVVKE